MRFLGDDVKCRRAKQREWINSLALEPNPYLQTSTRLCRLPQGREHLGPSSSVG